MGRITACLLAGSGMRLGPDSRVFVGRLRYASCVTPSPEASQPTHIGDQLAVASAVHTFTHVNGDDRGKKHVAFKVQPFHYESLWSV